MPYPVRFEADHAEQRSRLSVFFRFILLIPLAIALFFYGIVASIAIVVAWFAIVISARFPAALYEFVAGFTRFLTRVSAYALLLCDPYPPFSAATDPSYPIRLEFAGPFEHYSRLKTLFRFILVIPILILRYILTLLLEIGAIAAWFVIVIIGRLPRGFFDLLALGMGYIARSDAYVFLLTETYPPFEESEPLAEEVQPLLAEAPPPPAEAQPVGEEAQPVGEEAQPVGEEAQPVGEDEQPSAEEEQPSAEEPQPPPEQAQSSAEEEQPAAEGPHAPPEESQS